MYCTLNKYYRLSYHFSAASVGHLAEQFKREAFKYAVLAADVAIARGAYADGLENSWKANSMVVTLFECTALMELVEMAIDDLRPPGYVKALIRQVSISMIRDNSESFTQRSFGDDTLLLHSYERIRDQLIVSSGNFAKRAENVTNNNANTSFGLSNFMCCKKHDEAPKIKTAKLSWKTKYTKEKHTAWYDCCNSSGAINPNQQNGDH